MKTISAEDIGYELRISRDLAPIEYSKYITTVLGNITAYSEERKTTSIGSFEATVVSISKALYDENRNESLYDIIDQTQSITDVGDAILDIHTYEPKQRIQEMFSSTLTGDFVIIESVELNPEWRGANIGLAVIRDFISSNVEDGTLVVVQPGPLSRDVENETEAQIKRRVAKLTKHWSKLGFVKIPRTRFMAFSTEQVLPEIEVGA